MLDGLIGLCLELGPEMTGPEGADDAEKSAFLLALTAEETNWGDRWCAARYEQAYGRGGHYHKTSPDQIRLVQKYEDLAACSWGPTQILPVVAYEVGFRGHPWELAEPRTCLTWTVRRFNDRCFTRTVKFGEGFRQEPRPGVSIPAMFAFWNGGPSTLSDAPDGWLLQVRTYVAAQTAHMEVARQIIKENGSGGA